MIARALIACAALCGCVNFPEAPAPIRMPALGADSVIAADGAMLPARIIAPAQPVAVVVALHGMNDYSTAWTETAEAWRVRGIATIAYDQRGFGANADARRWAGAQALRADLRSAVFAARAHYPGAHVFAAGHSLGAAVILSAMGEAPLDVDGVILAAPGVWGGAQLPIPYRAAINIAASLAPGKTLTGESAGRQASDNIALMRRMYADPLVIKETRLDSVLGAVRLMGEAYDASDEAGGAVLLQYGDKDEIIPVRAMRDVGERLCGAVETQAFPDNWHLLYRDLAGEGPIEAAADWMLARAQDDPQAGAISAGPADLACADGLLADHPGVVIASAPPAAGW